MRLQSCGKAMGWCTDKMLLFCAKTIVKGSHNFQLARLKKKRKKENVLAVWQLSGSVLSRCFFMDHEALKNE